VAVQTPFHRTGGPRRELAGLLKGYRCSFRSRRAAGTFARDLSPEPADRRGRPTHTTR